MYGVSVADIAPSYKFLFLIIQFYVAGGILFLKALPSRIILHLPFSFSFHKNITFINSKLPHAKVHQHFQLLTHETQPFP